MRLLVACRQCHRQFDAGGLEVGERFACACGALVEVQSPQGHDAGIVRCSSCGGPREEQASRCKFCRADFTLHEQDLHTVCPACYARVSDRATFCHHCGGKMAAEPLAGARTSLECPACDEAQPLRDRALSDKVHVLECGSCAGFWLSNATFENLVDQATRNAVSPDSPGAAKKRRMATHQSDGGKWRYRGCPVCGDMMPRRNFARKSGVIVDLCREHGVWFDIEELPRLLAWVRAGGMQIAAGANKQSYTPPDDTARRARATSFGNADSDGFSDDLLGIGIVSLAAALARFLR